MTPTAIIRSIETINPFKKNPYYIYDDATTGNYIQCLRSPRGYILETRYFFNRNWSKFVHYRAWTPNGNSHPGKANPRSGEWGPWIHDRDHNALEPTAAAFLQFRKNPTALPEVKTLLWRNVTNEFP